MICPRGFWGFWESSGSGFGSAGFLGLEPESLHHRLLVFSGEKDEGSAPSQGSTADAAIEFLESVRVVAPTLPGSSPEAGLS